MGDLLERLKAALDEDERVAVAAGAGRHGMAPNGEHAIVAASYVPPVEKTKVGRIFGTSTRPEGPSMTGKPSLVHHQIVCANVFIRRGGRILVLRRSPTRPYAANVVHPVGGKVGPDEDPFTAAQREVTEETGLSVTNMRLEAVLLDLSPVPHEPHNWLIYHFSADCASGEPHETAEGELVWMTPAEFVKQPLHPSLQGIAEHILDPRKGTLFITHTYNAEGAINGRFENECVSRGGL